MKMVPVVSSSIAGVGYDSTRERLCVQFQTGKCYEYAGVPEGQFVAIITAESHGKTFHELVKKGGYSYKEIKLDQI